jgi:branched-subunit amino acid transport protein AzlD
MNHFLKYHLIAVAVFLVTYIPAFFLPATKLVKGFSNYTMFLFPLILLILMIRTYKGEKKLQLWEKCFYALTMVSTVTILNILFGYLNLPDMKMNEAEKSMGIIGINITYGIFELFLALIVAGIVKQKRRTPLANTVQA